MKAFGRLYQRLDSTTSINLKVEALVQYFQETPPQDAAWGLNLLLGKRQRRIVTSRMLRDAFLRSFPDFPEWLLEESYGHVGDTGETVSLLLASRGICPNESQHSVSLSSWMEDRISKLSGKEDQQRAEKIFEWWSRLSVDECYLLNKLLTGGLRVGVSQKLVVRALSKWSGISEAELTHRLMGEFEPSEENFQQLLSEGGGTKVPSQPYPFFLASPLEENDWKSLDFNHLQLEYKWDGIRAQLIFREGEVFLWSRGEDLITNQFPEIVEAASNLPQGTVLDGELLCWNEDQPLPFSFLQKRLGRKKVSSRLLESHPCILLAYDCLEANGEDLREHSLKERREILEILIQDCDEPRLKISSCLSADSKESLEILRNSSRDFGAEGLMLKKKESPYLSGRKRGHWWKYKVDPLTLDAVLIYAQAGSGRRANLFTDYTFALWKDSELVTFAKAYSGLDQKEIEELDRWIRQNTRERFGPVRSVEPFHVFEIAFEGISESNRHKSGIAVRFPRILRWRKDKVVSEADTLMNARKLLEAA